jgi:predicted  nucleic acid-binding Zn-ribbon protein
MYRGKRVYRYYNSREGSEEDCVSNFTMEKDLVVQGVTSLGRYYMKFESVESFFLWLSGVPEGERTFSEVIRPDNQKFKIDIDEKVDNIEEEVEKIKKVLISMGIKDPKLLVFDIERSYHVVMSNYCLQSYLHCKYVASIISKVVKIDEGVYSRLQHFRIEGCTKFKELRWKKRVESNLDLENFNEGVVGCLKNTEILVMKERIPTIRRKLSTGCNAVPEAFKERWRKGDLIVLDRTCPHFCQQCGRVHDRENAFMLHGKFYCRRKFLKT